MTIDVSWPWWVTSAIAAAVAVGSLIGMFLIRRPAVRGVLATFAVQSAAVAMIAPIVMGGSGSSAMHTMSDGADAGGAMAGPASPNGAATASQMPFTFFLTHYEFLGDPAEPSGVRYHSNGAPFAQAPDGSTITMTGAGGWDPARARADGGGRYFITSASGDVTGEGTWVVTGFVSFDQLPGWWGIPGFKEEGWQGPPGSPSFSGFLKVRVRLDRLGEGLLTAWCLMADVPMPADHIGDGITLTEGNFDFTDYHGSERSLEGVMFYGLANDSG